MWRLKFISKNFFKRPHVIISIFFLFLLTIFVRTTNIHRILGISTSTSPCTPPPSCLTGVPRCYPPQPVGGWCNTSPIKHIIYIIKENHSYDNLFGTFPGGNGATTYKNAQGNVVKLNHTPDSLINDIDHSHDGAVLAEDGGKEDKFSLLAGAVQNGVDVADSQYYQSDIPDYWQYAKEFTLADNYFSTILGPSFPAHLFTIGGEDDNVSDNPVNTGGGRFRWGCDSTPQTWVLQIQQNGIKNHIFPCFNYKTVADLLDEQKISWKYYAPPQDMAGYQWSTYDAINQIRNGVDWQQHVVGYNQFISDVQSGNLPAVSWVVQPMNVSEHPPYGECQGENYTVNQINAVMKNSSLWNSSAIVLTWDDFGGFYDHVYPPKGPNSQIEYGPRVPTLMISPYSRSGIVDNTFYSQPSVLKFIESTFGLPSLTSFDAQANDLGDMLNYNQKPLQPSVLPLLTCSNSYTISGRVVDVTNINTSKNILGDLGGVVVSDGQTTVVDSGGYVFHKIPAGTYTLTIKVPPGYKFAPGAHTSYTVTVGDSNPSPAIPDFQLIPTRVFNASGHVFEQSGSSWVGVSGVSVVNYARSAVTGSDGSFTINGIDPGDQSFIMVLPNGMTYVPNTKSEYDITFPTSSIPAINFYIMPKNTKPANNIHTTQVQQESTQLNKINNSNVSVTSKQTTQSNSSSNLFTSSIGSFFKGVFSFIGSIF